MVRRGLLLLLLLAAACGAGGSVLDYVDPFIGSGGSGYGAGSIPPGAQLPFSSARVSPDTVAASGVWLPFDHFGGYHYGDEEIRVFSHVHTQGAGGFAYGLVSSMPWRGSVGDRETRERYFFKQRFSHQRELASPGYYSVELEDGTRVEVTAGHFASKQRFSFARASAPCNLVFPVHGIPDSSVAYQVASVDLEACVVRGQVFQNGEMPGRFGGVHVHFVASFNASCSGGGTWDHGASNSGAWMSFPAETRGLEMSMAFSFINATVAQANAVAGSFDSMLADAQAAWTSALSQVSVQSDNEADTRIFYTALYHSMCAPSTFSEAGGLYRGFDNQTHVMAQGSTFYSDMSIWDIFRTQVPLLTLLKPNVTRDIMRSLVLMYQQGGDMPRWPLASGYTSAMDGQHADFMLLHAYANGVRDFDVASAYAGMRQGALNATQRRAGRHDLTDYMARGFVPYESSPKGACYTLEQSYDDWAVGTLASLLGKSADAAFFLNRSSNFENVWNVKHEMFCPKTRDGEWKCPLTKINVFDKRYVEGDAWHYRFYAPHAMPRLIQLYGGVERFTSLVSDFFTLSSLDHESFLPNPFMWIGNEPSELPAALAFAHVNRTDLVGRLSHLIMRENYGEDSSGLPGNCDYGAISSWYVWGALGFFPDPGTTRLALGMPLFRSVSIAMPSGGELSIIKHGDGDSASKILLNGQLHTSAWITTSDIARGAKLEFFA